MFRLAMNRVSLRAGGRLLSSSTVDAGRFGVKPLEVAMKSTTAMPSASMMKSVQAMQMHNARTKGDEELVTFLNEEIATEKKSLQAPQKTFEDFQVKFEDSVLTFTKKFNDESIVITLNVNHTVDAEPVADNNASNPEEVQMKSKPQFDVDIVKGGQTLCFSCSYAADETEGENQEEYNDLFVIDEVAIYEGESKDSTYAVAGEILDGYLYDLFMNMLEERGVTNDVVDKMSKYCTNYEHSLYVQLLTKLQTFVQSK